MKGETLAALISSQLLVHGLYLGIAPLAVFGGVSCTVFAMFIVIFHWD